MRPLDVRFDPSFPRKLWIYWHQGWKHAPKMVQRCAASWVQRNLTWQINFLAAEDLHRLVALPDFYKDKLALPLPALSDVIRCHLLAEHGGVWADSTTWCVRPLNEWLPKLLADAGFFAYAWPASNRPLSTWFLAAMPRHPIMERLKRATDEFWQQVAAGSSTQDVTDGPKSKDYFWVQRLFAELVRSDPLVAKLWAAVPQIKADAPHFLERAGLLARASHAVEFHIRCKLINVYKLSRRIELPGAIDDTVLGALFKSLPTDSSLAMTSIGE
jgi:hypothetical protein